MPFFILELKTFSLGSRIVDMALWDEPIVELSAKVRTYLQLPLLQWGAGNVYLLVLSSKKVNIAKNPIAVIGL